MFIIIERFTRWQDTMSKKMDQGLKAISNKFYITLFLYVHKRNYFLFHNNFKKSLIYFLILIMQRGLKFGLKANY